MKSILITLSFCFIAFSTLFGQSGTILNISTVPSNPTSSDSILIVGNLSFTSGNCDQQSIAAATIGNVIQVSSSHCIGLLTVICNATDSIKIAPQPDGIYTIIYTLDVGTAPIPCTPGIIPSDIDTFTFTVGNPNSIGELNSSNLFTCYPNPSNGTLQIEVNSTLIGKVFSIYGSDGRLYKQFRATAINQQLSLDLAAGLYWIEVNTPEQQLPAQRLLITK